MTQRRAQAWLRASGFGILLLTVIAIALHEPGSTWTGTLARKNAIVGLMLTSEPLLQTAVFLPAILLALRDPMTASPHLTQSAINGKS